MQEELIRLTVNGEPCEVFVKPNSTLLDVLRDQLDLTGTKLGCGSGDCGACTIIMNGKAVNACLVLAMKSDGAEVITIEGLTEGARLHPIQKAFMDKGALQCGFCTPGMILSAKVLLDTKPRPTIEEIKRSIVGNLCRCTGYVKIIEAIQSAAKDMPKSS
ncbi:(2Fe-2S)-binding protein [Chloroflexota bacterium]